MIRLTGTALILSYALAVVYAVDILSWDEAYAKADALVSQMSLEQKVNITSGTGWGNGPCVGNTGSTTNPDFPALCLQDSPLGIRYINNVSSGVAGINAAASFDKDAIRKRGQYMATEFRQMGAHAQLGPSMNMFRAPEGGRNWEAFGEDPYLTGVASVETIHGIQGEGVMAVAKHMIGNEQETHRNDVSSVIDDRAMHEIYLWPFARSVEAGVVSVMCAYNKVGSNWACEDDHSLNKLLKDELGFKGYVQSDWSATHSTVKSVMGGLDMNMPGDIIFGGGYSYFGQNLTDAVQSKSVPEDRVTDMAKRIVAAWYKLGQNKDYPKIRINSFQPDSIGPIDIRGNHNELIRSMGASSTVLLRNKDQVLPLKASIKKLAIIGADATGAPGGPNACPDHGCNEGTLAQGWGSGTAKFPYLIKPYDAIKSHIAPSVDIVSSFDNYDVRKAADLAKGADVALVFANADSGEEFITVEGNAGDRNNLHLWHNGDNLIKAVADANENTVVVIHSVGPVLMPWIDHPHIKAIVWPGLPGQESGNSLADVLLGKVNPSGRLPYTIAKKAEDYPAKITHEMEVPYTEGILVGYRWFDAKNIAPLFEFGYGLSYTSFYYDDIDIHVADDSRARPSISASVSVSNSGSLDGAEIVQAYIQFPKSANEPPKVLRGFEKVYLEKGSRTSVSFQFEKTELSYWDKQHHTWVVPAGNFTVYIGASSRDLRASRSFSLV